MFKIIDTNTFITIFIVICWVVFMSFVIFYSLLFPNICYIINKKQILKIYFIYIIFCLFVIFLFYLRFSRREFSLNVPEFFFKFKTIIFLILPEDLIILFLFVIFLIVFWLLCLTKLYQILKRYAVMLFIYYYQYTPFRKFHALVLNMRINYTLYLLRRVLLFTKNLIITDLAYKIWPQALNFLEKVIFLTLLPSLFIFDYFWNHGVVTKVFAVFPWFFLYSLLRSFYMVYVSSYTDENVKITYRLYGLK
jgi:hypothetical protein